MTWRSLREARRYLLLALLAEAAMTPFGGARGRLLAGTSLICLAFFRDPRRELTPDPDVVYAPADGRVVGVDTTPEKWLGGQEALRISTFLALYDVHVNRSPAPGQIVEAESIDGGYAPAFLRRAERNHRKRLAIDNGGRRVVVVQTAGLLARKISSWAWLGDRVGTGERIAVIHFGSRAEVLVPVGEALPLAHVGQRVRAGVTPLARYTREDVTA
ncbi:MAG: phosphatidylserine decarboxylase [Solirubrobacteraceae bacterium]|jgi:phosphatidylserine decarboxylase|nr:phosphatidylserine decarboxylase [Solirubrobacteraceae bacterium]MEA2479454.1 phosphatidylserine decarboxylase [Thermoleophilaceae bacterium]